MLWVVRYLKWWREGEDLRSEEEDDSQGEYKAGNTEVHPLYTLQGVVVDVLEEDEGGEHGCDNTANGLKGLGEVETELHPSWRAAGSL